MVRRRKVWGIEMHSPNPDWETHICVSYLGFAPCFPIMHGPTCMGHYCEHVRSVAAWCSVSRDRNESGLNPTGHPIRAAAAEAAEGAAAIFSPAQQGGDSSSHRHSPRSCTSLSLILEWMRTFNNLSSRSLICVFFCNRVHCNYEYKSEFDHGRWGAAFTTQ